MDEVLGKASITFRSPTQTADVSLDFLYRCTEIRRRGEQARQRSHPPGPATQLPDDSPSSVVRTVTAQLLAELKRQHRDEVQALRQALEAAESENLELRRHLGPRHTTRPKTS
ncbi:hypothetical protein [Streptomyces sp. NPDC097640]|uniref:hypothetical protein n=1 Tax=Streptomyces sp. NPDC097640 TaxID=3157229 RepID=UPI00332B4C41